MALLEDMLKGNLVIGAALGVTAFVLPKVFPDLSPQLRSVVQSGLSLFLESESEAEGGIIDRLAYNALKNVLRGLSGPGSAEDREQAAEAAVAHYKRTAHRRARRYGRDPADRSARYAKHIAALRRALDRDRTRHTGAKAAALKDLSASLAKASQHQTEEDRLGAI